MPSKSLVAIRRLHEDGRLGKTFGEDLSPDVVEADAVADVAPRLLHHRVPVHVRQQPQAESEEGGRGQVKRWHDYPKIGIVNRDSQGCDVSSRVWAEPKEPTQSGMRSRWRERI